MMAPAPGPRRHPGLGRPWPAGPRLGPPGPAAGAASYGAGQGCTITVTQLSVTLAGN